MPAGGVAWINIGRSKLPFATIPRIVLRWLLIELSERQWLFVYGGYGLRSSRCSSVLSTTFRQTLDPIAVRCSKRIRRRGGTSRSGIICAHADQRLFRERQAGVFVRVSSH